MGNSKNFLNTSQKTGRHDKMIAVNQGIFGLVHVLGIARTALAD
jgi:hypothetical protein